MNLLLRFAWFKVLFFRFFAFVIFFTYGYQFINCVYNQQLDELRKCINARVQRSNTQKRSSIFYVLLYLSSLYCIIAIVPPLAMYKRRCITNENRACE